jgi:hypothetical protein
MPAAELYAELVQHFAGVDGVELPTSGGPRRFGNGALTYGGAIFAMLSRGMLTVKLPEARVRELMAAGEGVPFTAGKSTRPMREWVAARETDLQLWIALAEEALAYARG